MLRIEARDAKQAAKRAALDTGGDVARALHPRRHPWVYAGILAGGVAAVAAGVLIARSKSDDDESGGRNRRSNGRATRNGTAARMAAGAVEHGKSLLGELLSAVRRAAISIVTAYLFSSVASREATEQAHLDDQYSSLDEPYA